VKVCSLYGVGYYYMPGTDICLKLGGYVRYQFTVNPGSSVSFGPFFGNAGHDDRINAVDTAQRVRTVATIDTRQQTAYGTLRTYMLLGWTHDTTSATGPSNASIYFNRGFIQVAGFTLGKATSFFDIYPNASFAYNPDTGDGGQIVATYTAQFGNGFSASIGIEQSRAASIVFTETGSGVFSAALAAAPATNRRGGLSVNGSGVNGLPDLVGNLRVDQAWGSILLAAALHENSGGYYGAPTLVGLEARGDPGSNWGYAITLGGIFNLPMIAPGDRFSFQAVYSEGAVRYAALNHPGSSFVNYGDSVGFGYATDGVFGCTTSVGAACNSGAADATDVQNTTSWSIAAAFEHLWTPALRTSIYGSYWEVTHNDTARTLMCNSGGVFAGATAANLGTCNPDFSSWVLGSRTQWEPVRGWIMGVDVIYLQMDSAQTDDGTVAASGPRVATTVDDQDAWVFTFRTQRNYHP
jgi:hypothetical protein